MSLNLDAVGSNLFCAFCLSHYVLTHATQALSQKKLTKGVRPKKSPDLIDQKSHKTGKKGAVTFESLFVWQYFLFLLVYEI